MQAFRRTFVRPAEPRALRITARDLVLLENIARLRLATTHQLAKLDGGSGQNVSRCLLALWENGYIDRPTEQVANRLLYAGSFATVYSLTRKGARELRMHGRDVRRRLLDGIDKQHKAGWRFIEHTVAISGFVGALEVALRGREDLELLHRGDILEDAPKSRRDRQARLATRIEMSGKSIHSAVIPDMLYGLRFDNAEESYFMLEWDTGEMAIERYRDLTQTHFAKKIATYLQASREGKHIHELGIPNFRVTTVTRTPARAEKMLEIVDKMTDGRGSNIFLFTDERTLAGSNPLDVEWRGGKGKRVRLTD